ncbi:MAG: hypothetical protein M0C28_13135, partial [Candidatus Moduliflexus flocculans]|nr:hypothetical protein [Candidatus Moduliflexus flocculans]
MSLSAAMAGGVTSMTLRTPAGAYGPLTLGLRGRHQVQNALVAVRLLEALSEAGRRRARAGDRAGPARGDMAGPARLAPPRRRAARAARRG